MGDTAVSEAVDPFTPYSLVHMVHSVLDAVVLLDANWNIVCLNRPAASLLGYDQEELNGSALSKILPGWKSGENRAHVTFDSGAVQKDKSIVPLTVTLVTWRSEQEQLHFALLGPGNQKSPNQTSVSATWELDVTRGDIQSSEEFAQLYGTENENAPKNYPDLLSRIHPEDRDYFDSAVKQAMQQGGYFNLDYRIIRSDGSVRAIEDRGEALVNASGKAIRLIGTSRDITGGVLENDELLRKISILNLLQQIAAAANEADDLDSLLQFTLDRICAVGGWDAGHVWLWSDTAGVLEPSLIWYARDEQSFRRLREETTTTRFSSGNGIPGRVLASSRAQWFQRIASGLDSRCDLAGIGNQHAVYALPIFIRDKTVGIMEFFISVNAPSPDPAIVEALAHAGSQIGRVMERVLANKELQKSREHLRALAARLQAVREEERIRIAREIHDELGQLLTVLKIDLTLLRQSFEEGSTGPQTGAELLRMARVSDSAIESVQRIASELRPMILDKLGFLEAIDWFCKEFSARTGIVCSLNVTSGNLSPTEDRATALFRIFQETLTNIARHSGATRATITITDSPDSYLLSVQDNGRGIKRSEMKADNSLGLLGMRERAVVLGGEVTISGEPGVGTLVSVQIPHEATGGSL